MNLIRIRLLTSAATLLLAWSASASDLAKGYTFSAGEKGVDHTKLNHLVDQAVINTTFYTDKSATTTPAAADIFLLYSSTADGFRKCSLDSLLFSNAGLITTQTEDAAPATNDFVLTYSVANTSLRKATLEELVFQNPGLITLQPRATNAPLPGGLVLISINGTYNAYALTNLLQEWWRWMPFSTNAPTNSLLSLHTSPTNSDLFLIWDSIGKTNKAITYSGLVTNLPAPPGNAITNLDEFTYLSRITNTANPYNTNPVMSRLTIAGLLTNGVPVTGKTLTNTDKFVFFSTASNAIPGGTNAVARVDFGTLASNVVMRTISSEITMGTGVLLDTAHGLAGTPQIVRGVLVCKTADLNYAIGDEVGVSLADTAGVPAFSCGGNATNYFAVCNDATPRVANRTTGTMTATTAGRWKFKLYAEYFP